MRALFEPTMDSGLSLRMQTAIKELVPLAAAVAPPKHPDPTSPLDLASAQNELLRAELLEFFKTTVEDNVTGQTLFSPDLFSQQSQRQLRGALATFCNTHFNPIHPVKPEHIVLTAGATDALESVIHAVCDDGDSVLVPGPRWCKHLCHPSARKHNPYNRNVQMVLSTPSNLEQT